MKTEQIAPKRVRKTPPAPVWCDYCNCELKPSAVKSCVRLKCKAKALVG